MKHLSTLSPAEILIILEGQDAPLKELLKITFMDLLLKQTIETTIVSRTSSRDKVRYYKYIIRGQHFNIKNPLEHEIVFLSAYQQSKSIKILHHHLIRMGFQNAISESKYRTSIRLSKNINQYFNKNLFQSVFGGFSINPVGIELRNNIKAEIAQLEKEFPLIISSNQIEAQEILSKIGGNIFLLRNIDFLLIKQIDNEILAEIERKHTETSGGSGCYGCSSWSNGCTGCSGSGCSGSGCSSCSGCGGCGGCGS